MNLIRRVVAGSAALLTLFSIGLSGCAASNDSQNYSDAVRAIAPNATKTVILSNEEIASIRAIMLV